MKVLVTGITGFVGGLVTPELLRAGHELVGLSRAPQHSRLGIPVVRGDVASGTGLEAALRGVEVAYYFVHSFEPDNREGFAARDRRAAQNFASAARRAGVRRIVYCGVSSAQVQPATESAHRKSRNEVESILLAACPDSVSLRSWMILSPRNQFLQFLIHLLRHQRFVALGPSASFRCRPVDGRDLGAALAAAAHSASLAGKIVDLAGPSVANTAEICAGLARCLGVAPRIVTLPFTPPAFLIEMLMKRAGQNPAMIMPVLGSMQAGDVLPAPDALRSLVGEPRSLEDSLHHTVELTQPPAPPIMVTPAT
jgi:uncharacterized protein YbjT (DUF2867 family)